MHLHVAHTLFDQGAATFNQVAAFPSLHAAYPVIALLVLWPMVARWLRGLLLAYAIAMGFMLVLTGEHWVIDVLGGWLISAMSYAVVQLLFRPK
jgi:membrane-associated phospholipid phosphatase